MQSLSWMHRARGPVVAALGVWLLVSCGGNADETPPPFYDVTTVVGASLSDTGNSCAASPASCPPSPPYAQGKYSNGPLWVEALAAGYGADVAPSLKGGTNFAFAGARTGSVRAALDQAGFTGILLSEAAGTAPTVPGINSALGTQPSQVDQLLASFKPRIHPLTLVVLDASAFGNNIVDALTLSAQYPADAAALSNAIVMGAVADIVSAAQRLQAGGAHTILMVNTPNVGATPKAQALGAAAMAAATQLSVAFNTALAQQVALLSNAKPSAHFVLFDLYALEAQIKGGTAPGGFALTHVTAPCFVSIAAVCSAPNSYFYWDGFHPTAALGAYLAQRAATLLPK